MYNGLLESAFLKKDMFINLFFYNCYMRCELVYNKRGATTTQIIGSIVLFLLVLFGILYFFIPNFWDQLGVVGLLGGTSSNIQPITAECELACLDGDRDGFCFNLTSKPLRMGDSRSIKGSCEAISNVGAIDSFEGIKGCPAAACGEVKEAVCSKGWTKYDCKTWLTEAEQRKIDAEQSKAEEEQKKAEEE